MNGASPKGSRCNLCNRTIDGPALHVPLGGAFFKCLAPCPVDIDSAQVSILEREVLVAHGFWPTAWPARMVLGYTASRSQWTNTLVRRMLLQGGGALQRAGARIIGSRWRRRPFLAPFYAPVPAISGKSMAAYYPRRRDFEHALLITPEIDPTATAFYFPGCGSERLHSDIGLAVLFLLLHTGVRVVLPPEYLCCGFPARANARTELGARLELRNTIIFNQIRSMLGHLDFDRCVVSCGTCREALLHNNTADIFAAPVVDAAEFVLARGLEVQLAQACRYHPPCHDSLDGHGEQLLRKIAPQVTTVPHCCSEAGTLALSRPDIAAAMLERKRTALKALPDETAHLQLLTNCPACLNGLGRHHRNTPPRHLAVALAEACAPDSWRTSALSLLAHAELVRI